jgi:hypothetical protein
VNREVVVANDKSRPLPEVDGDETTVVQTDEGVLGCRMPPVVASFEGVSGLPDEVASFASIVSCKTI